MVGVQLKADVEEQSNLSHDIRDQTRGAGLFHGMTYEEGVMNALEWVLGNYEEPPFDTDEVAQRLEGR